ncbi:hypothetical protein [Granulicella paludicola]|uniref:hypothetical protein n=1 Tax=Granulicella paludicola TaxID=474951 RepID=UPI0021E00188|nr:hypothetical protein [Granulicella paludicola]
MIECKEVVGRIVRSLKLHEDGPYGPEVSIDFEDGTVFTATVHNRHVLEGKLMRDDGGEPKLLSQCMTPSSPH